MSSSSTVAAPGPAVPLPAPSETSPPRWLDELRRTLPDTAILTPGDSLFHLSSTLFNAAIDSPAKCAVLVADAQQVSTVINFARQRGLTFSCKGGGFNVAGWAIQGDIILDLCLLDSIDVHTPDPSSGLVDVAPLQDCTVQRPISRDDATKMEQAARKRKATTPATGSPLLGLDGGSQDASSSANESSSAKRHATDGELSKLSLQRSASDLEPNLVSRSASRSSSSSHGGVAGRSGSGSGSGSGEASEETGETSRPSREASRSDTGVDDQQAKSAPATASPEVSTRSCVVDGTRSWVEDQTSRDGGSSSVTTPSTTRQSPRVSAPGSPITNAGHSLEEATSYDIPSSVPPFATAFANVYIPSIDDDGASPYPAAGRMPPFGISINASSFVLDPSALHRGSLNSNSNSNGILSPSSLAPHTGSNVAGPSNPRQTPNRATNGSTNDASPSGPHALVTIGAGAKSKQIDAATAPFSYHVPLAAYPVGCAVFASGGFGFLSRMHGLSMDNVVEVEMVLADGRIIYLTPPKSESVKGKETELAEEEIAQEAEMKELWWAFRGAGLALGVITRIRVKAFPVGLVYSGNLIFPFNPATSASLIKHWRDCIKNAPRELYTNLVLTAGPDDSSHVIVIQICYLGERDKGDQYLQALLSWEGERCLFKNVEMRTFLTQQDSVVQVLSAQRGHRWCIRADLMESLPDECIYSTVEQFRQIPERSAWLFELAAGAIADCPEEASCFPRSLRKAPFQVAAIHQWKEQADDDTWRLAARRWIDTTISPHSPGGSYPCFLESKEGIARTRSTFGGPGENWERLKRVKRRLDPEKMLRHCFWVDEDDPDVVRRCQDPGRTAAGGE